MMSVRTNTTFNAEVDIYDLGLTLRRMPHDVCVLMPNGFLDKIITYGFCIGDTV